MSRRMLIPVGFLLLVGCATNVAGPFRPAAVAQVQLLSMSPAVGSELTTETVLVAEIKYTIQNYKPSVDYYVGPLFASAKDSGTTFSMLDRLSDLPKITTPEGTVTVRYPVSRELKSPDLERPVRMWFYVLERTGGDDRTQVIGKTDELRFKVGS